MSRKPKPLRLSTCSCECVFTRGFPEDKLPPAVFVGYECIEDPETLRELSAWLLGAATWLGSAKNVKR